MIWIQFLISASIIIVAGIRLTTSADTLSERLNLGKVWVGVLLLGLVTSLPEAVATIAAVVNLKAYDLALGNILGSNCVNPMLVVIMDIVYRQGSVTDRIGYKGTHFIPAGCAVVATLFVMKDIAASTLIWGRFGLAGGVIVVLYLACMKILAGTTSKTQAESVAEQHSDENLSKVYVSIFFSTVLVVGAAIWLTAIADRIAFETGLGRTFVGSLLLATITSLPEIVVTLSAMKINEFDLAMGNIFGSNITNLFILAVCDWLTVSNILGRVSYSHMITAVLSIVLTGIVFLGVRSNNKKKLLGMGWDSWAMTVCFIVGMRILYQYR